ncbi:hypothetical protein [Frondihabitans sp. VKM Ac-2883]|uniref:hypothetical protein n=1 Tax=Frondihabitans sp. VKM Ac-2883 TaxID=2783823 RepID=UPI00188AD9DF|nr:hypothetical protein [Frondihabitans sp. VKM Ac-2883]MBF4574711.1 hypothetical protein [Frondihabitans sp. VKM Ac-2883]
MTNSAEHIEHAKALIANTDDDTLAPIQQGVLLLASVANSAVAIANSAADAVKVGRDIVGALTAIGAEIKKAKR